MHSKPMIAALLVLASATATAAGDGMVSMRSAHDVATTTERLVDTLEAKGMTVFRVIDHAAGAEGAGLELRPTRLVIFGNPKIGTRLMQCGQTAAIDLPQKMLVWEDASGATRVGYNAAEYVAERHDTGPCNGVVEKVGKALQAFAAAASGR
ncbi:MAG: DUF302 domain-containing protein [Halofilum sp. (in: g-proteobacteria)]|nr:DUF302 domain-containing protein [Halofilum sp. (in: g-proteobacteria)]